MNSDNNRQILGCPKQGGAVATIDPCGLPVPDWQHDFAMGVRSGKIQAAKRAVYLRLKAKSERPPGVVERIALNDAINLLRTLCSERLLYDSMTPANRCKKTGDEDEHRTENDSSEEWSSGA
jgi:hypothetical protein